MQSLLSRRAAVRLVVLSGITISLMLFLIKNLNIPVRQLANLHPGWLAVALLATVPYPLLNSMRWFYVLRGMRVAVGFWEVTRIVVGSGALSLLPGRVGDFSRALPLLGRVSTEVALGSVLFEKAIDVLVLLAMSAIGLALSGDPAFALLPLAALVLGIAGLRVLDRVVLLAPPRFQPRLRNLQRVSSQLLHDRGAVGKVIAVSALNWASSIVLSFALFRAADAVVPLAATVGLFPIAIFVGLLPFTLGGMGTRDAAIIALFVRWATPGQSLTVGVWYSVLGYWLAIVCGLPFVHSLVGKSPAVSGEIEVR